METINPGSKQAIAKGCTCPVLDNHGQGKEWYWVEEDCPLHGNSNTPKTGELGEEEQ